jgi:hypothetical protein
MTTIPLFTAEASLYRSRGNYSTTWSEGSGPTEANAIVPAYFPGSGTQHDCSICLGDVAKSLIICDAVPAVTAAVVCAASGWFTFGISCAAAGAALATALVACDAAALVATGVCAATTCCPKLCGTPNPFDPGSGCCDADEACVDQNDPNSRNGCCPSNQSVCAGKCCPVGSSCCGDTCCPLPNHCCGSTCCGPGVPCCGDSCCSLLPPPGTHTPTPPPTSCSAGSSPCGFPDSSGVIRTCCPPGLQCCSYSAQFGPDCKTSCLH